VLGVVDRRAMPDDIDPVPPQHRHHRTRAASELVAFPVENAVRPDLEHPLLHQRL